MGAGIGAEHATAVLDDMLASERGDAEGGLVARPHCAIAARQGLGPPAHVYATEPLFFAIEGRPDWRDPETAAVARAAGSAAALALAYDRYGAKFLDHLSGSFAAVIIDADRRRALLAVDRSGIRPLCYAHSRTGLVFGSSAEMVAAHPDVSTALSDQALFNYLYFHVVPGPRTIRRDVRKLVPGEVVTFVDGAASSRFYWQLKYAEQASDSVEHLEQRFRGLLREAAKGAIAGDEGVGAFLSGGTDSSTVTGLLAELTGSAKTYSIGFANEGFDEIEYARIAARHFRALPHEYYASPKDLLETIAVIASAYDEPFGNASAVPTYLCARMAQKDGVRVILAGDGGDEIFGGNARYAWQKLFEGYALVPRPVRERLVEPLAFGLPGLGKIAFGRKLQSYLRQASVPLPERLEAYNFLHRSPLAEIFEPDFLARIDATEPLALLRAEYDRAASRSSVNRMMFADLKFVLADNDLRKVVRMCEAAGLEVRFPLLDDELVRFSGELPASLKVKGMRLRHFFKEALRDFLPPETIAKKKHGFGVPFGLWLKQDARLAELVRDNLSRLQRRGIVRPSYISALLRQHADDHATYFGVMIWVLTMLECWLVARRL